MVLHIMQCASMLGRNNTLRNFQEIHSLYTIFKPYVTIDKEKKDA